MPYKIEDLLDSASTKNVCTLEGFPEEIVMKPLKVCDDQICRAKAYEYIARNESFKKLNADTGGGKDSSDEKAYLSYMNIYNDEYSVQILFHSCFLKDGSKYFYSADDIRRLDKTIFTRLLSEYRIVEMSSPALGKIGDQGFDEIYEDFKKKQTSGIPYATLMEFTQDLIDQIEKSPQAKQSLNYATSGEKTKKTKKK